MPVDRTPAVAGTAYAGLKFKAVIDWIELRVTLRGPTQFRHVQDRLVSSSAWRGRKPYVKEDPSDPRSFFLAIQDPAGAADVLRQIQPAARPGDPPITEDDIEITGIEVALDLYGANRERLIDATLHMYRHHARPPAEAPGGWPRLTAPAARSQAADVREIRVHLADLLTINAGQEGADYRARYYVKTTDTVDDSRAYAPLPPLQHRARMEITLSGAELPFRSLATWRAFNFDALTHRFGMRRTVDPESSKKLRPGQVTLARWLQARTVRYGGLPAKIQRAGRHQSKNRAWTEADGAWFKLARLAFKALTTAQRRAVRELEPQGQVLP